MVRHLKIGGRLTLVSLAALGGLILVLGFSLFRLDSVMRDDIADRTRKTVETARGVMVYYQQLESAGKLSRADAQGAALGAIKALRYGSNDYFWVNDMQPRVIMHPFKPELNGTDVGELADPDGVHLYRKMVDVVRAHGEGFVSYRWPKPNHSEAQPKISYVKGFAPWGWIIGSGVYVDDVRDAVMAAAIAQGLIVFAIILVVGGLNWAISRSIARPIVALTARMRALAAGDTAAGIPGIERGDELGEMAVALGVFRDAAIAKAEVEAAKAEADAEQAFVVETLSDRLARVSDGDLTAEIEVAFPASYVALRGNYNGAIGGLRELITSLSQSAETIRTGSGEIAHASDDLARRTEANAASLEQTSAALTQMEGRLRSTAASAGRTAAQASEAMATVDTGRAIADEAVAAMGRVADSAKGIDSVIEGLDKIAFQTRVLAMNAAVEAGRAGEAGRGFAVVADLVSALAMRSEEEAKRAGEQLTTTQADIVTAVGAVQRVDNALADITGGVEQVHQLVETMAEDNRAQSDTIGQITAAVGSMDQATQQNAAMVEQTSAAARNLANEVEGLSSRAARFKTAPGGAAQKPAARPARDERVRQRLSPTVARRASMSAANGHSAVPAADEWSSF